MKHFNSILWLMAGVVWCIGSLIHPELDIKCLYLSMGVLNICMSLMFFYKGQTK